MEVCGQRGHAGEDILAPIDGVAIEIGAVADPMFALELLGTSAAIEPTSSELRSPVSGVVTALPDSLHAVGITSDGGAEVLVHAGIDTIALRGKPFSPAVRIGDRVEAGDLLCTIDLEDIRKAGHATTVVVIVTNSGDYGSVEKADPGPIGAGDHLMHVIP